MNRYKIRNKKNGLEFEVTATQFPPKREPEWGNPPRVKKTADCTSAELLQATRFFEVEENGVMVQYCEFADEMHVYQVENIDAEIAATQTKKNNRAARLQKLKRADFTKVNNIQDVKDILKDVLEHLTED